MHSEEKLRQLVDGTDYTIIQRNGQRVYGLRTSNRYPCKGSELFIGRLPRDLFEDELVPIFSKIAPIYELRLMVDFSGNNRGYCFVRYFTREAAAAAIRLLDRYIVRAGCRLGVYWSVDNTRLFIGGLPRDKNRTELLEELMNFTDNIRNLIMYPAYNNNSLNRGYAFLEFENHREAAIARRRFPPGSTVWDCRLKVDWADPIPEPDPEIMSQVATLYMRNLPYMLTTGALKSELCKMINLQAILKVYKSNDYAFVHFNSRMAAEKALIILQDIEIANHDIEVTWARPQTFSRKHMSKITPDHYCMSLPAKGRWRIRKKSLKKLSPSKSRNGEDFTSESSGAESPINYYHYDQHKMRYLEFPLENNTPSSSSM